MEGQNPQTYVITPLDLNNVQLSFGRVLPRKTLVVIQQTRSDLQKTQKSIRRRGDFSSSKENKQTKEIPIDTPIIEQPLKLVKPPFLERLKINEGIEKQVVLPNYNMMDELRNVCIKIPLLQAIK